MPYATTNINLDFNARREDELKSDKCLRISLNRDNSYIDPDDLNFLEVFEEALYWSIPMSVYAVLRLNSRQEAAMNFLPDILMSEACGSHPHGLAYAMYLQTSPLIAWCLYRKRATNKRLRWWVQSVTAPNWVQSLEDILETFQLLGIYSLHFEQVNLEFRKFFVNLANAVLIERLFMTSTEEEETFQDVVMASLETCCHYNKKFAEAKLELTRRLEEFWDNAPYLGLATDLI
jgi:hypothetical protein